MNASPFLLLLTASALLAADAAKSTSPAKVPTPGKEAELNTVILTTQAEQRLGIATATVERRSVPRSRMFGGELLVPPGRTITVNAPLSGALAAGPLPAIGQAVKRGQRLFTLVPVLAPTDRVRLAETRADAEAQITQAKVQLDAARIVLTRAEALARAQAGSQRALDDARAAVATAEASLKAGETRAALLKKAGQDLDAGNLLSLPLEAPLDGMLLQVHATGGQQVAGGAPLFAVADFATLWLRVPVYAGELAALKSGEAARVSRLADKAGAAALSARPVAAPPSATPTASTVDLYFELANADARFRPGERVGVSLALIAEEQNLVAPWAAVLHDIHGNAWVYEQTAPQTFVRRRVSVDRVVGADAILASGPKPGAKLVTAGAAELFGTEFGSGK